MVNYAGDAVLAEFGTVAEALTSAVVIQRELADSNEGLPDHRQVKFRIGINLGDVIVDRNDIFGERRQRRGAACRAWPSRAGSASPNSVRLALGSKLALQFEDLGPQKVKNIAEPVRAWHVRAPPEVVIPAPIDESACPRSEPEGGGWRRCWPCRS